MTGRSEEAGPRVATILVRRKRLIGRTAGCIATGGPVGRAPAVGPGSMGVYCCSGRDGTCVAGVGQLHRPGLLFACINFEEAGAFKSAGQAILDAANGELLVPRAHEGPADHSPPRS